MDAVGLPLDRGKAGQHSLASRFHHRRPLSYSAWSPVGLATRGRQQDADDYFIASGMMSGWFGTLLVGLSLALFSGVSFLFYPAVVYNGGIVLFIGVAFS